MFVHFFLPFYVCTTLIDMTCSFWLVVENRAEIFISRGEGGRLWYWLRDTVLFFFAPGILGGVLQQINLCPTEWKINFIVPYPISRE